MRVIEIEKLPSGGHRNECMDEDFDIPSGYALIPGNMETPNFPFGDIEVEIINGVPTVTKWIPGEVPEKPEQPISETEQLRADVDFIAIMTGVEL